MSISSKHLFGIIFTVVFGMSAYGQEDSTTTELDLFWEEVSRTVSEADTVGARATYHRDAISVSLADRGTNIFRIYDHHPNKERIALIRAGEIVRGVEFIFHERVHSENAAKEIGMFHFWIQEMGEARRDVYGRLDAYLVKRDQWVMIVENQDWTATQQEWDEL